MDRFKSNLNQITFILRECSKANKLRKAKLDSLWLSKALHSAFSCFFALLFLGTSPAQAAPASSGFTYTGKILDSQGAPVTASSVIFTVTVYDPSAKCWLYTEQRDLDLSQSAGTFSFEIGSDDASTLSGAAPAFNNPASGGPKNLTDLFSNKRAFTGLGTANSCSGTYDPSASTDLNEGRVLAIYFTIGSSGTPQALPPLRLTPVPMALQSLSVNGYGTGELLRVDQSTVTSTGLANNALSAAQYTEFWSLLNKTSTAYLPVSGDVSLVSGNNKVTTLLGQALPAGPATNGQVLVSNGTAWTLQAMSGGGGSVSSVTGTAPVVVGGTATAPVVSLPAATTSASGYLTSTDWNTFNSKLPSSLASGKIFVGNASALATEVSLSGDATLNNAGVLSLKNTGTAGTYGSASLIPIVTTDAQGRVTSVTTAAPLDATKLPLAGGTMSGAIAMGAQDISNAGNISMAASKTLGLSSNASDPGSPSAGQVWYNSTTNLIKFYDGTSVQSLGVAGAGLTSFNGLTSSTQTFAIGTSGNSPAFSSATSTHTLNIPLASTASVTAGLISKADYDSFNTKLGAVSNTASLTAGKVWVGNASNAAVEQTLSGDITAVSNTGSVTANKTTTAQANKLLSLDGSGVVVSLGNQLNGSVSGALNLQASGTTTNYSLTFPATQGAAGQTLSNNGSGVLSWATLSPSQWITTGSDISYASGKVGIGTTAPLLTVQVGAFEAPDWGATATPAQLFLGQYNTSGGAIPLLVGNWNSPDLWAIGQASTASNGVLQIGNISSSNINGTWSATQDLVLKVPALNVTSTSISTTFAGNVGIGTTSPSQTLEVAGSVNVGSQTTRSTASTNRGQLALSSTFTKTSAGSTALDANDGNIQEVVNFVCNGTNTITFSNLRDGGVYTVLLSGSAAHSGTCVFAQAGFSFKTSGGNLAPTAGKDVLFTFAVIGTTVIYSMSDNLQ